MAVGPVFPFGVELTRMFVVIVVLEVSDVAGLVVGSSAWERNTSETKEMTARIKDGCTLKCRMD